MKKIFEDLIFVGRTDKEVELFGKKWKLTTVNSEDHLLASDYSNKYDPLSRAYSLRVELLARAVIEVDGEVLENSPEKFETFRKMQPVVINTLYAEYEKLIAEVNESLNPEEIKN